MNNRVQRLGEPAFGDPRVVKVIFGMLILRSENNVRKR